MNNKIKILIVEDEFMISEDIAYRLTDFGYEVAGTATNAKEALDILENSIIDLALLDVNIEGEMDGIELAKNISDKYQIPFIFLTSLANRTIVERAKECKPASYLLKPFNDRQVQIAIEMAITNFSEDKSEERPQTQNDDKSKSEPIIKMLNSLFLKRDSHYERVRFEDIMYLNSESNYTYIFTQTEKYTCPYVMKKFETKLPTDMFVRIHRSYLVNLNYITGFEGHVIFLGKTEIPISKNNRDEIFKLLKGV